MASANDDDDDRAAAVVLRLLLGMAAAGGPAFSPLPWGSGSGVLVVHQFIFYSDGDLFSGGVGGGVPTASKAATALKEVKAGEVEGGGPLGDCAICLVGVEDAGKEMPCGHPASTGSASGALASLGVHANCPVCRHELPAAKEENAAAEGGAKRRAPTRRRPRSR